MRKDFSLPLSWAHLRPTVIAFGLNCGQDDCPDLGVEMCEHYRKTMRLLANHLSFSKFYSYYEKTKSDDGFNGSTDVSYSMTSAYRACVLCVCVCVSQLY